MIRHTQTYFGDGADGSTPGNCMQTAVASLLDLPLEDVPHFAALPEENWWLAFLDWLSSHRLHMTVFADRFDRVTLFPPQALMTAPLELAPRNRLVIACGTSPREYRHAVLWQHGELVHDPHPSGDGLKDAPDEFWLIEPEAA